MDTTAAVVFTLSELWLCRAFVRHEMAAQGTWAFPPASAELNDQIAAAIWFCTTNQIDEAALSLSWGDTLLIDYVIPQDAKDPNGVLIGRNVLLKSFAAREHLRREFPLESAPEPAAITKAEVQARLKTQEHDDAHPD